MRSFVVLASLVAVTLADTAADFVAPVSQKYSSRLIEPDNVGDRGKNCSSA